jgi:hypothetical protein
MKLLYDGSHSDNQQISNRWRRFFSAGLWTASVVKRQVYGGNSYECCARLTNQAKYRRIQPSLSYEVRKFTDAETVTLELEDAARYRF